MARRKLIRSKEFPYHVTARANNKEPFPLERGRLWKILTDELYLLTILYRAEIHAFVLMPNHIHLLISAPEEDLGVLMSIFLSAVTKQVNYASGRSGRLFGARYFWTIITSTKYYGNVLKYVYRNPVKGRLCGLVEEYEFSTAGGILGTTLLPVPVSYTRIGLEVNLPDPEYPDAWGTWLNRPFSSELEMFIQKSLRRKVIKEEKVPGYFLK